jgi:hypothetical protein
MNRYHIKIGFKEVDKIKLKTLTNRLNNLKWNYTKHCLDNLNFRFIDIESILKFIKDTELNYNDIFEFYIDKDITKICYRIKYNNAIDLILILGMNKQIITIYINDNDDLHFTLNKNIYNEP